MIGVWNANNLQETKIETLETKTDKLEIDEATGKTKFNNRILFDITNDPVTVENDSALTLTFEGTGHSYTAFWWILANHARC